MTGHEGIRISDPDITPQGCVSALGADYGTKLQQALFDAFATEDIPLHKYAALQELAELIIQEQKALADDMYYLLQNCKDCSRCAFGTVRHRGIYDAWVCACPSAPECRPQWRGVQP